MGAVYKARQVSLDRFVASAALTTPQTLALNPGPGLNGDVPGVLGRWAAAHDALVVHYSTDYVFDGRRRGFLQVVRGNIEVDGESLSAGDAVATQDHARLTVRAVDDSELLLFDMA